MTVRRSSGRKLLRNTSAALAAVAMLMFGAVPATAEEAPSATGSISGTVVAEIDGSPVPDIEVEATHQGTGVGTQATTDANGQYTLEGLEVGEYLVRFLAGGGLASEYWPSSAEWWGAETVVVTEGTAVTGIDASLASTGSIGGSVMRASDSSPVAGVRVVASGAEGGWSSTLTDANGEYVLTGLLADSYFVAFHAQGTDLMRAYWQNASDWNSATPVSVSAGEDITGIDAALEVGGTITGTVTRASDGSPVADVTVNALDANNEILSFGTTDADGVYALNGLPAGSTVVQFLSGDDALLDEYWDNAHSFADATGVETAPGTAVGGIDAALDATGVLSGSVTLASDGAPVFAAISITARGGDGANYFDFTDEDGNYSVSVAPGEYIVYFNPMSDGVLAEYWDDARTASQATAVSVVGGQEVAGIDAQLDAASVISGTVTLDSDEDREVFVEALVDGEVIGHAHASLEDGSFSLSVPAGTYVLRADAIFYNGSRTTVAPQYFDGVDSAEDATPVTVSDEEVGGIDFTLVSDKSGPSLEVSASSVTAGDEVIVSGSDYFSNETVAFELHSDPIALGTLSADEDGAIQGGLRIPASAPAGTHTLVALDGDSNVIASISLTVTAAGSSTGGNGSPGGNGTAGGGLASTGIDVPVVAATIAVGAVALGVLLMLRRRRAEV